MPSLLDEPVVRPPLASPGAPGPLGRLADLAYRRRGRVVLLWLAVLGIAFGLSSTLGGTFTADYGAPGSDSQAAQDLLTERFPAQAGDVVDVVVLSDGPALTDPQVRSRVDEVLESLGRVDHVAAVESPYATGAVSPDGRTALAHLRLDVDNPVDMPETATERLMELADDASADGLRLALNGQAIAQAEEGEIGSEGIGLLAAAVILLVTFGSVVAAGLPLLVAVSGLAVSSLLTTVLISFVEAPDWSTSLAAMIGIGIGIDYTLLMVTRFREWRAEGLDPRAATVATLDTAGRSVLLAGSTVLISMLGLFAMGLSFMRGAAAVTILGVAVVLAAAMTLFPALLGYTGRHVDRFRLPLPRRRSVVAPASSGWVRWSRWLQRHRVLAAVTGTGLLLAMAAPLLAVDFGFPDAGNNAKDRTSRTAYEWTAEAFGAGANGPLLLATRLPSGATADGLAELTRTLRTTAGVAQVSEPTLNAARDTAVVTVLPTTGPQADTTQDLVHRLREGVLPAFERTSGAQIHVGGVTAASIDSTDNMVSRIPLLIGGVVLLSMLLLLVAFRSIAVAVKAAVMNLLSVAAAYGVVGLMLQGGSVGGLFGISEPTPLPAFIPVLMFAILFGLSMDYEVFLVARMREGWLETRDNAQAIVSGLAGTARVITAAAAIMIAVFAAFIPSPVIYLKVIGIGLAAAILIDATVVRMLLVPAVMHLLGRANWWMPASWERTLPQLHVEGVPENHRASPVHAEGAAAR